MWIYLDENVHNTSAHPVCGAVCTDEVMNRDQIICPCLDITAGQIMDAYKEGAKSVEAIKEVTGAGTACGACLDEIEELIQSL